MALAAPTSISVRSIMWLSNFFLSLALLAAAPIQATAQSQSVIPATQHQPLAEIGSAKRCSVAARAIRNWGWGDSDESGSSSVASIVAAVNYELRVNSGRLPARDIERLRMAAWSADACVRELSIGILETQSEGKIARGRSTRLVKSVTPLSEKQSSTGEDITP